jgi:N-sulfoglucosamine sulfohydrolase
MYFKSLFTIFFCLLSLFILHAQQIAPKPRPNVLLIVADDMNWDSPECFGGKTKGLTPNIDKLAGEGMRFWHAYVNISICTPSRSVILSGQYPQNNGAEGFQRIKPGTPTLPAILNKAGYLCGTVGKPLRQQELFQWSVTYRWQGTGDENLWGRDPEVYRKFAKDFFSMAKTSNQAFFLMANAHDPHAPFAGGKATKKFQERGAASKIFGSKDVVLPPLLSELPDLKNSYAAYCTSVRRLDDMLAAVLDELDKSGFADNTIVIFMSDHGMPFPGAKFNCYVDSLRTPLIIKWPEKVKANIIDRTHVVSAIDLQPTILEMLDIKAAGTEDGRSFWPLLQGEKQDDREFVFGQFYHIHGGDALPMRSVISKKGCYVFNPWSNGTRQFNRLGKAAKVLKDAAKNNKEMGRYYQHQLYRSVEEYFDLSSDPNCKKNIIAKDLTEVQKKELTSLKLVLRKWMLDIKDPSLKAFDSKSTEALEAFMHSYRAKAQKEVDDLKPYEKANGYRF